MMQKIVLIIALNFICLISLAQKEFPFGNGEKLTYAVGYKAALINTDVAEVVITTTLDVRSGVEIVEANVHAKVYPAYKWFFDLNDSYVSTMDARTLRPKRLAVEISEGKYRVSSQYDYDWDAGVVNTAYRNHKNTGYTYKNMALGKGSFDGVATFMNMRNREPEEFTPGKRELIKLLTDDTIRTLGYKFVGREVKKIKGLGTFKTLKFTCQLAISNGEAFKDGSEITLWISDDRNKIPLLIESPIRIGSVLARLIKYGNLKYELESRIK